MARYFTSWVYTSFRVMRRFWAARFRFPGIEMHRCESTCWGTWHYWCAQIVPTVEWDAANLVQPIVPLNESTTLRPQVCAKIDSSHLCNPSIFKIQKRSEDKSSKVEELGTGVKTKNRNLEPSPHTQQYHQHASQSQSHSSMCQSQSPSGTK